MSMQQNYRLSRAVEKMDQTRICFSVHVGRCSLHVACCYYNNYLLVCQMRFSLKNVCKFILIWSSPSQKKSSLLTARKAIMVAGGGDLAEKHNVHWFEYPQQPLCTDGLDTVTQNIRDRYDALNTDDKFYKVVKNTGVSIEGDSKKVDEISGMKIWEASIDLVEWLPSWKKEWKDLRVLEIGCGHGLPGLFAMQNGAKVFFQDFSRGTLAKVTQYNCALNSSEISKNVPEFISGDWNDVTNAFLEKEMQGDLQNGDGKVDVIFCAECVYNQEQFEPIINLCKKLLHKHGVMFVSGKRLYFGCSGGTASFSDVVDYSHKDLYCRDVKVFEDGGSNVREIVAVGFSGVEFDPFSQMELG